MLTMIWHTTLDSPFPQACFYRGVRLQQGPQAAAPTQGSADYENLRQAN
jgi:hypothetical protein